MHCADTPESSLVRNPFVWLQRVVPPSADELCRGIIQSAEISNSACLSVGGPSKTSCGCVSQSASWRMPLQVSGYVMKRHAALISALQDLFPSDHLYMHQVVNNSSMNSNHAIMITRHMNRAAIPNDSKCDEVTAPVMPPLT